MPEPPLLLVHGEDRHRVDDEVRRWRELADTAELGIEVIDPPAPLDRVRSALAEIPLLDDRRFVLLRDPPQLGGGRRAGGGDRELAVALELRAPSTSVCLVCHQQLSSSHSVVEAVHRLGGEVRLRAPLRGRELRVWAEEAAAARGLRLRPGGLEHLLRVAGSDLGVVSAELDKLSSYQRGDGAVSPAAPSGSDPRSPRPSGGAVELEVVRRLVAGAEGVEVWAVLERLLGPDPARGAALTLELVEEGRPAVYLIATLAGQLGELRRAQSLLAGGVSPGALAGKLGIPQWRADRLVRQARAIPASIVEEWMRRLHRLDVAIKSGESDDRQGVGVFALGAARTAAARSRG
jgi:DNA polymerase III subunit delta